MATQLDNGAVEALGLLTEKMQDAKLSASEPWRFTTIGGIQQTILRVVRIVLRYLYAIMCAVATSFLAVFGLGQSTTSTSEKPTKVRPTAYFDGMRGIGSLAVYHFHHLKWAYEKHDALWHFEQGFGWNGQYYLSALPGVRLFFTGGDSAVVMFYIFAGFVLASPLLKCINADDFEGLSKRIISSIFRRWFRLFLPVFLVSFLWMTSWHVLGIADGAQAFTPCDTYWQELRRWFHETCAYSALDHRYVYNRYLTFSWFIPTQFKASSILFLATLALGRSPPNKRILLMVAFTIYFVYVIDMWYMGCTTIGYLLADLYLLDENDTLPPLLKALKPKQTWMYYVMFAVGVWFASCPGWANTPSAVAEQPGWYYLSLLTPTNVHDSRWYYVTIGTTLLIVSIPRISFIRSILEGSICQRLGRISFMIYLTHGPLLWSIGDRIYAAVGRRRGAHEKMIPNWIDKFPLPEWGPAGLQVNYIVPQAIMFVMSIWVASIAQWTIEEPVARFTDRLFKWATTQAWKPSTPRR